jgi:hypothetical protein
MVRTVLAWFLGVALFNFILFVICFFWETIRSVLVTPYGMFLAFLLIVCVVTCITRGSDKKSKLCSAKRSE